MTSRLFSNQVTRRRPVFMSSTIATIIWTIVPDPLFHFRPFHSPWKVQSDNRKTPRRLCWWVGGWVGDGGDREGGEYAVRASMIRLWQGFSFFSGLFYSFFFLDNFWIRLDMIGWLQQAARFTSVTLLPSGNKWKWKPSDWSQLVATNQPTNPIRSFLFLSFFLFPLFFLYPSLFFNE